jgi:hypothetical protein
VPTFPFILDNGWRMMYIGAGFIIGLPEKVTIGKKRPIVTDSTNVL